MNEHIAELVSLMENVSDRGCAVGICFVGGNPKAYHFSYAPEFLRRYEAENLSIHDNTLKAGFRSDGIFVWRQLEDEMGSSKAYQVAQSFGMVDGVCFSETVNGFKSIGSISLTAPAELSQIPCDEIRKAMQLAALAVSREIFGFHEVKIL